MTGHSSTTAMMRMLRSAGTSAEVVAACRHFRCQACSERQRPPQPSSTTTAPPYRFNRQVICDAFEVVDAAGQKHTVLSLVDSLRVAPLLRSAVPSSSIPPGSPGQGHQPSFRWTRAFTIAARSPP